MVCAHVALNRRRAGIPIRADRAPSQGVGALPDCMVWTPADSWDERYVGRFVPKGEQNRYTCVLGRPGVAGFCAEFGAVRVGYVPAYLRGRTPYQLLRFRIPRGE